MKKYLILGLLGIILIVSAEIVLAAKPNFQVAKVINPITEETKNTVKIPAKAIQVAPNIFYLGVIMEKEKVIEGYAFIDYKAGFGKPSKCNNDGVCQKWEDSSCADCQGGGGNSDCYGFLANGTKWKTSEPYIVNASNTQGLSDSFVRTNLVSDIAKWENAAGTDILGEETSGIVDGADTVSPDGKNEVYFGDIDQPGAIAITIVWGVFSGPPKQRKLIEWDQVYDEVDFNWSSDCQSENCDTKMDFENIATHELGHAVGLNDLYEGKCSEQTMYGWADYGEIIKRTLEIGDITGIQNLY